MSHVARGWLGKVMYDGWMLRRRLAETRRPRLVLATSLLVILMGLLSLAEGIMLGWFFQHLVPGASDLTLLNYLAPWMKTNNWLVGVILIMMGVFGVLAGVAMAGSNRRFGAYLALLLVSVFAGAGITLVYAGSTGAAPFLTGMGAVDLAAGVAAAVMLALGWYTLDPLNLHWSGHRDEGAVTGAG